MDLDDSFKRMLETKRGKQNKENDPPSAQKKTEAPEKPVRKDLVKPNSDFSFGSGTKTPFQLSGNEDSVYAGDDDNSSYFAQNTTANDPEYSAINRLMANCDIDNTGEAIELMENLSPCKMVGLMRPSTICEETNTSSKMDDDSIEGGSIAVETDASFFTTNVQNKTASSVYSIDDDSLDEQCVNRIKNEHNPADDTLEEVECVLNKDGLKYVPKGKNPPIIEIDEVILIDSSPENSFTTAKNGGQTLSAETTTASYVTAKNDNPSVESTFYSFATAKADANDDLLDDSKTVESVDRNPTPTNPEITTTETTSAPTVIENDRFVPNMKDIHDLSHESVEPEPLNDTDDMPEFNNTLDRIEYMMEQGQKMMAASRQPFSSPAVRNISSPAVTKTPTSILKKKPNVTPTPTPSPAKRGFGVFKRPDLLRSSPSTSGKKQQPMNFGSSNSASKIPKFKLPTTNQRLTPSSVSRSQFRHIESPIAAYIKNTPEVPFMKAVKPLKNFFDSSYCNNMSRDSEQVGRPSIVQTSEPVISSLPRKAFTAASYKQVRQAMGAYCYTHTTNGNYLSDYRWPTNCDTRRQNHPEIDWQHTIGYPT